MSNVLDAVLAQYEKNQMGGAQSKMSQDERMKKYFALILGDKEKSGQRRVRILPTQDGSSPFKEAWYHEIQVGGQWQKFYDPGKNDNERSPLNEVYEELMSTGKDSDKELAKQYKSRKFYIVKVIDRDNCGAVCSYKRVVINCARCTDRCDVVIYAPRLNIKL